MWTMLAGVPGKLKTLIDRLTATRAANLDKLDANITTRAAASTALSNAVWSDARAGYLDAPVSRGAVKSVQAGYADTNTSPGSGQDTRYIDVAISGVNPAKSIVIFSAAESFSGISPVARLNGASSIRISSYSSSVTVIRGQWQVAEFY